VARSEEFAVFVASSSDSLLRTAFLLTRDWNRAEDLLQSALAKAWTAWSRVNDDPEPYVRAIVVNTYVSWWRRRWRAEVPTGAALDQVATGSDAFAGVDDRDELWGALGRLPRGQRAVIVLRYFEDLSEIETARLLGISAGTVKSQASRALAALRIDPSLRTDAASAGSDPAEPRWVDHPVVGAEGD